MGGFTVIYLKKRDAETIASLNTKLAECGVAKKYRFYSEDNILLEYNAFLAKKGVFPEYQFPRDKIKSLTDFKQYWSPKAIGEIFIPYVGSLVFDCYFGRTSKRAMRNLSKFLTINHREILGVRGSFDTFMERGMTKADQKFINELMSSNTIQTFNGSTPYNTNN